MIEKIRHNTVERLRGGISEESVSGSWEIQKRRNHREGVTAVLKQFLRALPSLQTLGHLEHPLKLCEIYFCAFRCCVSLSEGLCGYGGILNEGQAISAGNWMPQEQPSAPKGHQLPAVSGRTLKYVLHSPLETFQQDWALVCIAVIHMSVFFNHLFSLSYFTSALFSASGATPKQAIFLESLSQGLRHIFYTASRGEQSFLLFSLPHFLFFQN